MKQIRPTLYGITLSSFLILSSARGQETTAEILGTITDQAGAVINSATVIAENVDTHASRTTRTCTSGDYAFTLLRPGTYTVTITNPGFKTVTIPRIALVVGDHARNDVQLQVGATTQTIEVTQRRRHSRRTAQS